MSVLALEQLDAHGHRRLEHDALGFSTSRRSAHRARAGRRSSCFRLRRTPAASGRKPLQLAPQQALEHLLRRLRLVRQVAEHRAAVRGERFEVEHLRARGARARAAAGSCRCRSGRIRRATETRRGSRSSSVDDRAAIGAVAAIEPADAPADLGRARARTRRCAGRRASSRRAAASRAGGRESARCRWRAMLRAHERRADLARLERRALLVDRADARALASSSTGQLIAPEM